MRDESRLLIIGGLLLVVGMYGCISAGLVDGFTLQALDTGEHEGWWLGFLLVPIGLFLILESWLIFRRRIK